MLDALGCACVVEAYNRLVFRSCTLARSFLKLLLFRNSVLEPTDLGEHRLLFVVDHRLLRSVAVLSCRIDISVILKHHDQLSVRILLLAAEGVVSRDFRLKVLNEGHSIRLQLRVGPTNSSFLHAVGPKVNLFFLDLYIRHPSLGNILVPTRYLSRSVCTLQLVLDLELDIVPVVFGLTDQTTFGLDQALGLVAVELLVFLVVQFVPAFAVHHELHTAPRKTTDAWIEIVKFGAASVAKVGLSRPCSLLRYPCCRSPIPDHIRLRYVPRYELVVNFRKDTLLSVRPDYFGTGPGVSEPWLH